MCPEKRKVTKVLEDLLELENRGNISDYLVININYETDGSITISQPRCKFNLYFTSILFMIQLREGTEIEG